MKRILCLLLLVAVLLCGCKSEAPAETTAPTTVPVTEPTQPTGQEVLENAVYMVGICLPEKTEKWEAAANIINQKLLALQCGSYIRYAENDPATQAEQIENLTRDGVDGLIIAPVDSMELLEVMAGVKQAGVPVVSYERLLMYSDAVSAFVGFNYRQLGRDMGAHLEQTLCLEVALDYEESYTAEFFMGAPEDDSTLELYLGLMEVLQPYLDTGALVCPSGRWAFEDCCVIGGDADTVKSRFESVMKAHYSEKLPDVICTASDVFSTVCVDMLAAMPDRPQGWPLVTGVGGGQDIYDRIHEGRQTWSVQQDVDGLAQLAAKTIFDLMAGNELAVSETTRNNYQIDVPAFFGTVEIITE